MTAPCHTIEIKSRALSLLVLASLSLGLHRSALADTATPPSYLPPPKDEVVRFETLEVNGTKDDNVYSVQRSLTATKTDSALIDVPQSITVVTRELINDQAMRSMGDITRYVPGVGIAQGEGNRDTPVLRGNSTTADFFIDGVRDDAQYFRDVYNVDRVEFLKGPNAMIFGRGGSGGLINRVSKLANGHVVNELSLQAGSWDQYRATFDYAQPFSPAGKSSYRVTALFEDAGSYRDDVTLRRYGLNPTFYFPVADRTIVRAGYEYFDDERTADRGISSYQGRPVNVPASTFFGNPDLSLSTATVHTVFLTIDHRFAGGATLRNHTRFGRYEKFYQNIYPGAVNAAGTSVSLSAYNNVTDRDNLVNQTDLVLPFSTGKIRHQFLAGLELARQETDNLRLTGYFTSISPTTTSVQVPLALPRTSLPMIFQPNATDASNHGVAQTVAFYAQDQIALTSSLQAIVGIRWESFKIDFLNKRTNTPVSDDDKLVSPRAGLIFKPAPNLSVYGSLSLTHVPRAGEQLTSLTLASRSLESEKFENKELGLKWDARQDLALTLAAYQLDRSNVAITDPADPTRTLLVDGQRARGLEFGITGRVTSRWSVAGGYAYQDGQIKTTQSPTIRAGARLAQLPRHTFSLWNRAELSERWGLGVGLIHRGEIFANIDNTVRLPGFTRVDAAIFCRLSKNFRAQLNIENLLDRTYYASAHSNTNITPGSPRAFRLSVTTSL